jgi:putative peptidoglycan lipid II flippase
VNFTKSVIRTEIIKSSAGISLISGIRMCLGIISQMAIAYYFGTTRELDIFFISYAFPSVVSGIVLALFSSSIIPELTLIHDNPEKLQQTVSTLFIYAFIIFLLIGLSGFVFSKEILALTTNLRKDDIAVAQRLSGLMWIIVGSEVLNSFFVSLYNLKKKFFVPSLFLMLPIIGMIAGTITLSRKMGVTGLVIGWLSVTFFSCIMLSRALFRDYGFSLKKIKLLDTHAISCITSFFPISISLMPFTILPFIDAYWLSELPDGSMSYIGYSTRITVAIGVLIINGIYTVILPYLSENIKNDEHDLFLSSLRLSIKAVLFIVIPVVIFCFIYREPLLKVFLQRGKFDTMSLKGVTAVLPYYLIGLLAMSPSTLINRAYFAKKMFNRAGIISVILIIAYFTSAGFLSHTYSYIGIGITYAAYWFIFFLITVVLLDKTILNSDILLFTTKIFVSSFISVIFSYAVCFKIILFPATIEMINSILTLIVIFYIMNRYILRTKEISNLIEIINLRRKC